MTDKLKPCPCCYSGVIAMGEEFVFGIQTRCKLKCGLCGFTLTARTTKKAIKKWNRRADNEP